MKKPATLVLMILDGWGYCQQTTHNAIASAHTPQWDKWWQTRPHVLLQASGLPVGLPDEQMGNSEVGHMHIGAGRVIPQDFTRINDAIQNQSFSKNPVFLSVIDDLNTRHKALHVMGLLSPGGVHSHEQHLFEFLKLCAQQHYSTVYLHLFLDGRDTPPQSAAASLSALDSILTQYPIARIASITGRYYAMDRDKRWERLEPVYQLLTSSSNAQYFDTAKEALSFYYEKHIFDEFIPPTKIGINPVIEDGDAVFFFNFRADRARQLTQSLLDDNFQGFVRHNRPKIAHFISMTPYASYLATESAFPNQTLNNTLGEVLAHENLRQLRLAETEKYAHVTFFLNGGFDGTFKNETRSLIESPKVATYDLQPEMSAPQLTKTLVEAIIGQQYDVIICNYANADMVGHTGNFKATVKAIECLDDAMKTVSEALSQVGGQLLITADHGNAEAMFDDDTNQAHTAHTNALVPFLYVGDEMWQAAQSIGSLIDIAPTVLTLLNIRPPLEMTGTSLLKHAH
jgi:2,3-bisphosphoglycerate-independent phosphoglycerate mutase